MTLSKRVHESMKDAEANLRNALAFASRHERPMVLNEIAAMIKGIDNVIHTDKVLDQLEERQEGDSGLFEPKWDDEDYDL
tara:strand:- start:376 stop:615 length:240 start_codon:yes stop_codon:yes gene_type:complete